MDPRPEKKLHRLGDAPGLQAATLNRIAAETDVSGVSLDSRRVQPGDLYAALPGEHTHGANFAAQAASAGASAILTDPDGAELVAAAGVGLPMVQSPDPRAILGEISAWVYGTGELSLEIIGVTGTNGKTTMSYLLESSLSQMGRICGLIGTTGIHIADKKLPSSRTTPESPDVHALLAVMAEAGVQSVLMEVSSHALALGRVAGVNFDVAVFTNLTQDHLDFHLDMADYFAAKSTLFQSEHAARAVICTDDEWGRRLNRSVSIPRTTYAIDGPADWTLADDETFQNGSWQATARGPGDLRAQLGSRLAGRFNQANALGALAVLAALGYDPQRSADGIANCRGVPGRMEPVPAPGFAVFVDYAHTPDAVERAVGAAKQFCPGRITVVLGCGGDRDQAKRPIMGRVAAEGADLLIITDDNPRSEAPTVIREAMLAGTRAAVNPGEVKVVGDRQQAIRESVFDAESGDCILVLGKGHESGQEVGGVVHPFSDREQIKNAIAEREMSQS